MGHLLVSAVSYFIQQTLLDPMLQFLSSVLGSVAGASTALLQLPWVGPVETASGVIAGILLTLKIGWEALNKYILFNEGTADTSGALIWKGAARAAFFIAADVLLVSQVFQWGLALGRMFLAAPLVGIVHQTQSWEQSVLAIPSAGAGLILFLLLFLLVITVGLVVITFQMAVRGAEIVFYAMAGPFVAVGQLSADGGVWHSWWKGLVILSLSNAWQFLALKAFLGLSQFLDTGAAGSMPGGASAGLMVALLFGLGLIVVALRGPHILREWSYHTGTGGSLGDAAGSVLQNRATSYLKK
jgi:hypothetical protein